MRALRLRFVLVAAGVLVPVALLVWRALASVEVERRARHEVLAERLFDEMEQALSELLASEEARPVAAYAAPPAGRAGDPAFVVARFEVAPDGAVTAPGDVRASVERLWRGVGAAPAAAEAQASRPDVSAGGPRPGATVDVSRGPQALRKDLADEKAGGKAPSAYDALRSLNQAAEQRVARQKKLSDEGERLAAVKTKAEADARAVGREDAPQAAGHGAGKFAADAPPEAAAPVGQRDAEAAGDDARAAAFLPAEPGPMVGRLVEASRLALVRTVVRDGGGWRQGVLLDVPGLGTWLRERALGPGAQLADFASVSVVPAGASPSSGPPADFTYVHRFADPFAALAARLDLRALPGLGGARYVYALSALLVVAMGLGLVALYRMVAVTVAFAERRSDFVAAVSHELKTPLTAIRMYGEMLRDGMVASDAKRDEYHRHITAESERLSRLIDNVLEFSRLEKHARPVALVVGPVGGVLDEAATLLRPHVERSGFTLRIEAEPGLPPARFERDALLQVLVNLVDNAVKYAAGAARKEIVLRARRVGDRLVLSVRDHGPGVPAAHLVRIFEPFYRGERELVRRSKGTGLGLALVRGLGEAMGATVAGHNVPEGGFEVCVALVAEPGAAA